jgi:tRNA-2-methylthio-N6-dimethylallyladenosine synthase
MVQAEMKRYYIWTIGCQMNEADSGRVAAALDTLGYSPASSAESADVIVLNTCVVRQSAEDRATGRLHSVSPLKQRNPNLVLALMGCMVGTRPNPKLRERFPFVDVFMPPSDPGPLIGFLNLRELEADARADEAAELATRQTVQDSGPRIGSAESLSRPAQQSLRHLTLSGTTPVAAHVPVVYGCSHACTYCVIPYRRGAEHSREMSAVLAEIRDLVAQGVKEVTLLGQIVDRYGKDFAGGRPDLADLLEAANDIEGLQRIRFLTSHPNYMTDRILHSVASLPKVCEQIEVPVQAGDNDVLAAMHRGYTNEGYRDLVRHIRELIPDSAIHTDIIVGFPGETDEQFQRTHKLLADLRLDKVHLAMYSPRPETVSARRMADDVPDSVKRQRWQMLEDLQARVVGEINARLMGTTVEVLVDGKHKHRWRGRTRTNKLVYFADERDLLGRLAMVRITWTGPWSMVGETADS